MRERFRFSPHHGRVVTISEWIKANAPPDLHSETIEAPMITRPLPPYRSVITGEEIDGRTAHREHLKAHDAEEVGNDFNFASDKPTMPPIERDIKDAIEQIRAGTHDPRPVDPLIGGHEDLVDVDTRIYS